MPHSAAARILLYRLLAAAFEYPRPETWQWLKGKDLRRDAAFAIRAAFPGGAAAEAAGAFLERLAACGLSEAGEEHARYFGHTARGPCPPYETEYGDIKADPLFMPHRIADVGAFYRAFGMEAGQDARERLDHVAVECEFMAVLAAREAYALTMGLGEEKVQMCRQAQERFLSGHLGRWAPAFTRRLARAAEGKFLGCLAALAEEIIVRDCAAFGVEPGSRDLALRPVDESAEVLSGECGAAAACPATAGGSP